MGATQLATLLVRPDLPCDADPDDHGSGRGSQRRYLVQPHVVSKVIDSEGNIVVSNDTTVKRQVISEDTSARISAMLQETRYHRNREKRFRCRISCGGQNGNL